MAFKLVSKNNMGVVFTLILVILLSQSKFFDFLTETYLGRMVILVFIIFISYTSKFMGLLAVLFIIIAFNQNEYSIHSYNYFEGFDVSANDTDMSGNLEISKTSNEIMVESTLEENKKDKSTNQAKEGFCMSDRELNILRGKQSTSVPVYNKSREQKDDVDPSDKSVFSSDYALF